MSDDVGTRAYLNDLCTALTEALGLEVRPHRAPSPAALASAFAHERVHLAWVSPVLCVMDGGLSEATPLVHSVRHGLVRYHGVMFARADGRVRTIADLRGARVAWVAPSSAAGYLFPRMAIAREDATLLNSFAGEQILGSHGAVVEAVASGAADAGATFAVFQGGDPSRPLVRAGFASEEEPKDGFRVLSVSDSIPSDVIIASPTLMSTLSIDPVAALEGLGKNELAATAMQHVLGADAFERCVASELDGLRFRLRDLLAAAG